MRQLNGVFTQASNRRHGRVGHLFQGRFKAILVDKEGYRLELSRYVVLNPVRAGMAAMPEDWPWSSYGAMIGATSVPDWLVTDGLLSQFGSQRTKAQVAYRRFVREGIGKSIWDGLRQQIYLGDDAFVQRMQAKGASSPEKLGVPKIQQRAPAASLGQIASRYEERNSAIVAAYATGGYSYREIADFFDLHLATVGRIVRASREWRKS